MTGFKYIGSELDLFAHAGHWKRYFARLTRDYVRGRVLEVGAGLGETTRALMSPAVSRWVCVEPDARHTDRLRASRIAGGVEPEVVTGDISAVALHERFDTILYIDVLEHILDDRAELLAASRHLAPGGSLVVLAPAFMSFFSAFDRAIGHHRRYTRRTLEAAFPPGLQRAKTFYADAVGMLLSLANSFALRQSMPTRRQILFWDRVIIPISRVLDPLVGRRFGRSVIAVYQAPGAA